MLICEIERGTSGEAVDYISVFQTLGVYISHIFSVVAMTMDSGPTLSEF